MAYYVQIDHATQSQFPDGPEVPADRLSIHYDEFLWLYVNAELPTGSSLNGEYYVLPGGAHIPLDPPTVSGRVHRFSLTHYYLSPSTHYIFHFADNLASPRYEDQWEIVTVAADSPRRMSLKGIEAIEKALIAYVHQHPGATGAEIDTALGISTKDVNPFGETLRSRLRQAGRLRCEEDPHRWFLAMSKKRGVV
jgi:hypothetical protein